MKEYIIPCGGRVENTRMIEMYNWCYEMFGSTSPESWMVLNTVPHATGLVRFTFCNEAHAILFDLRWI